MLGVSSAGVIYRSVDPPGLPRSRNQIQAVTPSQCSKDPADRAPTPRRTLIIFDHRPCRQQSARGPSFPRHMESTWHGCGSTARASGWMRTSRWRPSWTTGTRRPGQRPTPCAPEDYRVEHALLRGDLTCRLQRSVRLVPDFQRHKTLNLETPRRWTSGCLLDPLVHDCAEAPMAAIG